MSEALVAAQLRILDANANRAREGIRTAEDYIRFMGGDSHWAGQLKTIRNAITDILRALFGENHLLLYRDAAGDPLRAAPHNLVIGTEVNACTVAQRGLKRAQEALRVLEENLRGVHGGAAIQLSGYRYTLYDAEQWLVRCSLNANILNSSHVYVLITESICKRDVRTTVEAVLKGGARVLQVREKTKDDQALLDLLRDVQSLCQEHKALLICNDRPDLALISGTAGVHLGQDDLAPAEARTVTAHRLLLGRSTHSMEQARQAVEVEGVDYIGIGALYPTTTKSAQVVGLTIAGEICAQYSGTPVFAIGGITLDRVEELKKAGIRRVAVSAAIVGADDPKVATQQFVDAFAS